jgi:hypothetical protein
MPMQAKKHSPSTTPDTSCIRGNRFKQYLFRLESSCGVLKHSLCIDKHVESIAEQSFLFNYCEKTAGSIKRRLITSGQKPAKDASEKVSPSQLRFGPAPK